MVIAAVAFYVLYFKVLDGQLMNDESERTLKEDIMV
jgi:hypothetical protein